MSQCVILLMAAVLGGDWEAWRGPDGNGIANGPAPVTWSESENVIWKASVPGRGHSSPILSGDQVLLTTADESKEIQSIVSFDRASGKLLWSTEVSRSGFAPKIHSKNTHATPTLACDGERIFGTFCHDLAVQLVCLNRSGEIQWSKIVGGYRPARYQFGYAPSPLLYGDSVIVASEFEKEGFLAAFDCATGEERWRTPRGEYNNYSSPMIARTGGKEQLLLSGGAKVSGFDPTSGKLLWSCPGMWDVTCGTMVWTDDLVFASGGYPKNGTMAVKSDGSGEVVWQNLVKCYEQSLLVHDGYLYGVSDAGVGYCWNDATGEEQWKTRLVSPISASLVLAGENLYAMSEKGETVVFQASPRKYQEVARNRLGDESFATPAICDGRIFLRVASRENGARQESLFCIGSK